MRLTTRTCLVVLPLLFLTEGCARKGPQRLSITGNITLKGIPLDQGRIEFLPTEQGQSFATGAMILNGAYTVPAEHGLPLGKYRVIIHSTAPPTGDPSEKAPGSDLPILKERIPPSYNSESTVTVEVTADGPNRFDFMID
jgi:hypothetical protein